ncbi:hypothetical protein ASC70_03725 [Caulobacter sp. Root343]|nr:hypothetical protein ASC62_19530 [Caulobacter sp. Root342]KQV70731.1 hypothetical protein ASC70_03725 [Caulobacter sp. Root343]
MAASLATPALAQVSGGVAVQSDYRLRGYSISDGRAVGVLDLSYDHASGLYANGSVIGGKGRSGDLDVVGLIGNVGYARRLNDRLTLDTGVVQTSRMQHYSPRTTGRYTEGYVGLNAGDLSARISYSPNYLRHGVKTLYGEINAGVDTVAQLRLDGHLGYLACVDAPAGQRCTDRIVWRIGASRRFDRLELQAALTGAEAPGGRDLRLDGNPALTFGASWTF